MLIKLIFFQEKFFLKKKNFFKKKQYCQGKKLSGERFFVGGKIVGQKISLKNVLLEKISLKK